MVLDAYKQTPIVNLKNLLKEDFNNNRIMEMYRVWPRRLAIQAHIYCSESSLSLRRINQTHNSKEKKTKQRMAVVNCLNGNILSFTVLFVLCFKMVRVQAKLWGVDIFMFTERSNTQSWKV